MRKPLAYHTKFLPGVKCHPSYTNKNGTCSYCGFDPNDPTPSLEAEIKTLRGVLVNLLDNMPGWTKQSEHDAIERARAALAKGDGQ